MFLGILCYIISTVEIIWVGVRKRPVEENKELGFFFKSLSLIRVTEFCCMPIKLILAHAVVHLKGYDVILTCFNGSMFCEKNFKLQIRHISDGTKFNIKIDILFPLRRNRFSHLLVRFLVCVFVGVGE